MTKEEKLGSGGYAKIYARGEDKVFKDIYYEIDSLALETSAMLTLSQPHLGETFAIKVLKVKAYKIGYTMKRYEESLKELTDMPEQQAKKILFQLLIALYNADRMGIIHSDVKPENILIDKDSNIVLADWGISQYYLAHDRLERITQTVSYRSPEVSLGLRYDSKIDIWSAALTYCYLVNAYDPVDVVDGIILNMIESFGFPTREDYPEAYEEHYQDFAELIDKELISGRKPLEAYMSHLNDSAKSLIANMLQYNPAKRYNAAQCLNHEYFSDLVVYKFDERFNISIFNEYRSLHHDPKLKRGIDTFQNRKSIIDYILQAVKQLKLDLAIVICSMMIVDTIRVSTEVNNEKLPLLILGAIKLIGEIFTEEIPDQDIITISGDKYNSEDITKVVRIIYRKMGYNLYFMTPAIALNFITKNLSVKIDKNAALRLIIGKMAQLDYYEHNEVALAIAAIKLQKIEIYQSYGLAEKIDRAMKFLSRE